LQTLQKLPEKIMNVTDGIERLVNSPAAQESLRDLDGLIRGIATEVQHLIASLTATSNAARRTFVASREDPLHGGGTAGGDGGELIDAMTKAGASLDQMRSTLGSYQKVAVQNANVGYDLTRTLADLDCRRALRAFAGPVSRAAPGGRAEGKEV